MKSSNLQTIELCILIPCYNNFSGLVKSIDSINYTAGRYMVLVVDDGSSEPIDSQLLTDSLLLKTMPVKILRCPQNKGITAALNTGLSFIYAHLAVQFIARLDCGDTCSPERFYCQVSFLQTNTDIGLVGSWCYFKDTATGEAYKYITPTRHKPIERSMNFRNVFIHPTVMWRLSSLPGIKYPEQFPFAEDYGLFYGMISTITSAIIKDFLVTCEINEKGISIYNRALQLNSRLKVITHYSKNRFLFLLGYIKLKLLMWLPYGLVLNTKKILYKI